MKSLRLLLVLLSPMLLFLGCSKEKSFEVGSGSTTSQWEFTEGSNNFHGKVDTAYKTEIAAGVTALMLEGTSDDGTGLLTLGILGLTPSGTGVYQSPVVLFDYSKGTGTLYQNDISAAGQFTIEITKMDSASVTGVFSGKAKDSSGALKTITNGKFSAKFGSSNTPPAGTGQITIWSKKGCGGGASPIKVELISSIATLTTNITAFSATEPACGAQGTATFNVPAGSYTYRAICGTDTLNQVVTVASGQCVKSEVAFASGPPAQYSLVASGGNCSNFQIHGTYFAGKPVSPDTNTVSVQVNVTVIGAYTISTNTVNGYSFSASGTFTNTGVQTVTLKGQGTPVAIGTNSFLVTAGSSTCSFAVTVLTRPAVSTNSWSFTDGTISRNFNGPIDFAYFGDDPFVTSGKTLFLSGTIPNSDSTMDLYIPFPVSATQPVTGTYITNPSTQDGTDWYLYDSASSVGYYYVKDPSFPSPPSDLKLTIIITSYDPVTKVVKGTFSGKAWNRSRNVVTITNGKFDAEVLY